jgi:hypothetical protein
MSGAGQKRSDRSVERIVLAGMIFLTAFSAGMQISYAEPPIGTFYYPPGNQPPGPPPNYNQVDTSYFLGTPVLPLPPPDSGGVYIWIDSSGWNIANHIYSQGNSLEQFHGSVLAMLQSPPQPGVNIFANGFELFGDTSGNLCYKQNDRWGWYQWSENLYEIWWDVCTREWQQGSGDLNDFMVINIAGCAIDFNVWSSGHGGPFDTDQIFLGENMISLNNVPGFVDTYPGVSDPYQSQAGNDPTTDPNITIFAPISGTGMSYNVDGVITAGQTYPCGKVLGQNYGDRFAGSFVYEGNGVQFSSSCLSDPCLDNTPPVAVSPPDTAILNCGSAQICLPGFFGTDADGNLLSVEVSGGSLSGDTVCFTPVEGQNIITFICTDECGAADTAVTVVTVDFNQPPTASSPGDTAMFVCDPGQICLAGFTYGDPDGNVASVDVTGGVLNGDQVCFTPVEGAHIITMIVTDECGLADTVSTTVTIDLNEAPAAASPADTTIFACDLSQICIPGFIYSDPDGNILSAEVTGGTLSGDTVCFNPVEGANSLLMIVTDECGAADTAVTVVNINLNQPPVANVPADTALFLCELGQICLPGFTYSDADGNVSSVQVTGGTLSGDTVCFTPVVGANALTMIVTDACGAADTASIAVTITLNRPPIATAPADTALFVCDLSQVCIPGFTFSDADGNIASVQALGGTLNGSDICFNPVIGTNTLTLIVTDDCGESDTAITVVNIGLNTPPTAIAPNDTTVLLCEPGQYCLPGFSYVDNDNNVVSVVVTGGTLDGDIVCLTPVEGDNLITIIVSDVCGAADTASTILTAGVNAAPVVQCPGDTSVSFLCEVSEICVGPFMAGDADGNIDSSYIFTDGFSGTFNGTDFCFTPNMRAVYQVNFVTIDLCGESDTCSMNVDVQMTNEPPSVSCPGDTSMVVCDLGEICLPGFGFGDPNNNVASVTSSVGVYNNGSVCFNPTVGENNIAVTVVDSCGLFATCTASVFIVMNTPPQVTCVDDTVMVVDDLSEICLSGIGFTDVDGNIAAIDVTGGYMAGDDICFLPEPGINTVTVVVVDECGAADTCEVKVTVGYCAYMPGDANADFEVNGADITIMVSFFKDGPPLPDTCDCRPDLNIYPFFGAGDVNGNCLFNGVDVTYLYNYFISVVDVLLYCPSCPPTGGWIASRKQRELPEPAAIGKGERLTTRRPEQ